ncbi:HlyD family efflux transporter periplasmic adaptor subunit [Dyella soli]|uniref:Biotin/lipoyl-binding protein n=1 Tax=Dyella soli TaxID=522319 RepID=A0A4R0YMH5_9GAMM|nr:biotin/lipoyl-binding protein [Dyella soli]TCI10077.1 biotin/lipoyl-binding protein [Dyella soli]
MTTAKYPAWLGRSLTVVALLAALVLLAATVFVVDRRPRTHDAHLFAYTAGIAPEVSGRLTVIHVINNQLVRKGDVLAQIDPEPFELRLRQARAKVAALKADIDLTGRQVNSQTSGAQAASTQIERAREQLALARSTRERLEPMVGKGYVTQQQIDEARTNERTASTALSASMLQAAQAHEAVGDTASLIEQLAGAEAAEALAARDLREATIRAPFDGRVVGMQLAEGAFAAAGSPLFTLIKWHEWYAVADFRETDLEHIHVGDKATAWLMGREGEPVHGHVESLGAGVQPEDKAGPGLPAVTRSLNWVVVAQRFPVWVRLDDPPEELMRIGATASVKVQHDHHD